MDRVGARAAVESMIEERAASARSAIDVAGLPAIAADGLLRLTSAVITRDR
jgi:hypothetical protein